MVGPGVGPGVTVWGREGEFNVEEMYPVEFVPEMEICWFIFSKDNGDWWNEVIKHPRSRNTSVWTFCVKFKLANPSYLVGSDYA